MTKQKRMGRRVKIFYFTYDFFYDFMQESIKGRYKLLHMKGLPRDGKVVNVWTDHVRDCFAIAIEHQSFEEVPEGALIPSIDAEITKLDVEVEIK